MFQAPWLLAVGMILAPPLCGLGLGLFGRRLRGKPVQSRVVLVVLVVLLTALALPLAPLLPAVGFWDVVLCLVLFALGLALGLALPEGSAGKRLLVSILAKVLVTAALLEIGARLLFPSNHVFQAGATTAVTPYEFWSAFDPNRWQLLFPDQHPRELAQALAQPGTPRRAPPSHRVLHVGDSMLVLGEWGRPLTESFPGRLARLTPEMDQVNLGVAATGIDFHYQLIHTLLPRLHADVVVLYVFGADLWLIDRAYLFCGLQPLLADTPTGLRTRCPQPQRPQDAIAHLRSPPPLPFRVAVDFSRFAQIGFVAYMKQFPEYPFADRHDADAVLAAREPHFARILGAVADDVAAHGARLIVVALPDRAALDGDKSSQALYQRIVARASAVLAPRGVLVLGAQEPFADVVARDGSDSWFIDSCHFRAKGHERLAQWLSGKLRAVLATRP